MMKLLLDTHIFLWFVSGSNQLSAIFRDSIQNPNNTVKIGEVIVMTFKPEQSDQAILPIITVTIKIVYKIGTQLAVK